ncbi:hypothetical protein ACWCXX_27755 [Streptomyces sp. NPDC001732]
MGGTASDRGPDTRPQPKRTPTTVPAWEPPSLIASTDDAKVFGERLHTYSHADAIKDGTLADHQLLIPTTTDTDLRTVLTNQHDAHTGFAPTARCTSALHLAIPKAMTGSAHQHPSPQRRRGLASRRAAVFADRTASVRRVVQAIAARAPRKNTAHRPDHDTHRLLARCFRFDFTHDPDRNTQLTALDPN